MIHVHYIKYFSWLFLEKQHYCISSLVNEDPKAHSIKLISYARHDCCLKPKSLFTSPQYSFVIEFLRYTDILMVWLFKYNFFFFFYFEILIQVFSLWMCLAYLDSPQLPIYRWDLFTKELNWNENNLLKKLSQVGFLCICETEWLLYSKSWSRKPAIWA